jgi:hypothetical protein
MSIARSILEPRVEAALNRLRDVDGYLLAAGVNERSVTHRLAMYLQESLPEWDVDCEYNRDGMKPKRAVLPVGRVNTDDLKARTVYPDIIVHRRGVAGPNILAVEVKIDATPDDREWDIRKLRAYHEEFAYQHGVFVDIRLGSPRDVTFALAWESEVPACLPNEH